MPSAKGEVWRNDYWLPRALAKELGHLEPANECNHDWDEWVCKHCKGHKWHIVLRDYALSDTLVTMTLWLTMKPMIVSRGLWKVYLKKLEMTPVAVGMERHGITAKKSHLDELVTKYTEEADEAGRQCMSIAANMGYELSLPRGAGRNNSLTTFVFEHLKVPVKFVTETGAPSLNKDAKADYLATLPPGPALDFFKAFSYRGKRETALGYMDSYQRFWHPTRDPDIFLLHPVLNPCKTRTLRWSSERPNSQNISKQEVECERCNGDGCKACNFSGISFRSTRYCFGPEEGYEWYSMDFKNLELRLPAFLCGETEMIRLFEKPNEPPYYGSNHLLNFSTVYPDIWLAAVKKVGEEKAGPWCKKEYNDTWYQWCKNMGFAILYGCQRAKADATAHKYGAYDLLNVRFREMHKLSQECIRFANKHGYVETIPDRTVDPKHGYPLMCTLTERGDVLSTVPLSYKIQSSAMWETGKGMIRCQGVIDSWQRDEGFFSYIAMQVHDEMVFGLPKQAVSPVDDLPMEKKYGAKWRGQSNLWRVRVLQREMEKGGWMDYGIPTPVGVEYHPDNWGVGISL
jgi:DNA polymerase I-like protein with 3'-5' exonuclease and polymerase domains